MKIPRDKIVFEAERVSYIKRIVCEMNKELDAIIVEGKKDEKVFLVLGFEKKIIRCSSKDLEEIENDIRSLKKDSKKVKVAILTDFDEKGRDMNKRIKNYLQNKGVIVENFYRNKIKEISYDIKEIEDLKKRVSNYNKNFLPVI